MLGTQKTKSSSAEESPFLKRLLDRAVPVPFDDVAPYYDRYGETPEMVEALVQADILDKEEACKAWGDSIKVAWVDPLASVVSPEAIEAITIDVARKANVIGIYKINGVLTFATSQPHDESLLRRVAYITQCEVSPVFALPGDIAAAVGMHYASNEGVTAIVEEFERTQGNLMAKLAREDLSSLKESKPLAKIIDALL